MIRITILLINLLLLTGIQTRSTPLQDTLKMSRAECEARFLSQNLLLIAAKMEIPKAEALLLQTQKWPNPQLTVDQINLWATSRQTRGEEAVPPLFGQFGRNQQFGIEVEQLIYTARKRSKLLEIEKVRVEKASTDFSELLRNLKIEFRLALNKLSFLQSNHHLYQNQLSATQQLVTVYEHQVREGNIPASELVRLRALSLELAQKMNLLHQDVTATQKELKQWMHLPPQSYLVLEEINNIDTPSPLLNLSAVLEQARQNRPDLEVATLDYELEQKQWAYEKAKRHPDLVLKAAYDRNGNALLNFFGVGATVNLPLFDRNQGNIKYAELEKDQAKSRLDHLWVGVENEVVAAYQNLNSTIQFYNQIKPDYEQELDQLLLAYRQNLLERNVSLVEYLDFLNAYMQNKSILNETKKSLADKMEELNYSVGADLVKYRN